MTVITEKERDMEKEIQYIVFETSFEDIALSTKSEGEDERTFVATISTSSVDRVGDRILQGAFKNLNKEPIPLLWSHDTRELPLGKTMWIKWDNKVSGYIAKFVMASHAKAVDAYGLIKEGFIRKVSVGFRVMRDGAMANEYGGYDIKSGELHEVSLVNVPANNEATITAVKSLIDSGALILTDGTLEEMGITKDDTGLPGTDDENPIPAIDPIPDPKLNEKCKMISIIQAIEAQIIELKGLYELVYNTPDSSIVEDVTVKEADSGSAVESDTPQDTSSDGDQQDFIILTD